MRPKFLLRQLGQHHFWRIAVVTVCQAAWAFQARAGGSPDFVPAREMAEVQQRIVTYQKSNSLPGGVLRVVYFQPKDVEPLPGWRDRLERVMDDISGFYGAGMWQYGFTNAGIPLERKAGRLVIHLVRGRKQPGSYQFDSGGETAKEIRQALKGEVDLDRERVLVFYALCRKEPDGHYVFSAPYYGMSTRASGLAHAADCEWLDPLQLTNKENRIVYAEHYYPHIEQTVAQFNSFYLGGVAHELGHALGLPHDAGSPEEQKNGTSLMGGGNLNYREDLWGGPAPSFLSLASALRLASLPLFTGYAPKHWKPAGGRFGSLKFSAGPGVLRISGRVTGKVEPYAVIGYLLPAGLNDDHWTLTYPVLVTNNLFALDIKFSRATNYDLRLTSCHLNGDTDDLSLPFQCTTKGTPDVAKLNRRRWR